jgi:hypothetical protein
MAYWWVSQNETWKEEQQGGYIWAPKQTDTGGTFFHWLNMTKVRPGDIIFSYVNQKIVAVSTAITSAYDKDQPEFRRRLWQSSGWRVELSYSVLETPLPILPRARELMRLLTKKYSPLTKDGTGAQGYLFAVPPQAGRWLLDQIGAEAPGQDVQALDHAIASSNYDKTEREALVQSRVGQGRFRQGVERICGAVCCVTYVRDRRLLRASRIKPWSDCNNAERLDPYNGLLLGALYDAAFDAGLISFADDGRVMISTELTQADLRAAGLAPDVRISLKPQHCVYLEYHRNEKFLG